MKFNEFWTALCKKTSGGFESQTLAQECPFKATYSSGKIIVTPHYKTREERPLANNEFYKVWIKAAKLPKHEVFIRKNSVIARNKTTDINNVNQTPPNQITSRIPGIPRAFTNILDDSLSDINRKK